MKALAIITLLVTTIICQDTINVLLIGKIDSGKTRLINNLATYTLANEGQTRKINTITLNPETKYEIGYRIKFYDTPGLWSMTSRTTYDILYDIGQIKEVDVVILCFDLTINPGDDITTLNLIKSTYEPWIVNKMLIVYTRGDITDNGEKLKDTRYSGLLSKNIPRFVSYNTQLSNHKILQKIVEIGKYSKYNILPVPYTLNKCYSGECTKLVITLYGCLNIHRECKILFNDIKIEWIKIKNYVRNNMPNAVVDIYDCSTYVGYDNHFCKTFEYKPAIKIPLYFGTHYRHTNSIQLNSFTSLLYDNY